VVLRALEKEPERRYQQASALRAPFFFIAALLMFMVETVVIVEPGQSPPGPTWWQWLLRLTVLPLGLTAPFGTTLLGVIALSRIRHAGGRLYGLGLALCDVLLFPLLALNALIIWLGQLGGRPVARELAKVLGQDGADAILAIFIVLACVVITGLIVREAWRRARVFPGGS
jgi:hypothetical protein